LGKKVAQPPDRVLGQFIYNWSSLQWWGFPIGFLVFKGANAAAISAAAEIAAWSVRPDVQLKDALADIQSKVQPLVDQDLKTG